MMRGPLWIGMMFVTVVSTTGCANSRAARYPGSDTANGLASVPAVSGRLESPYGVLKTGPSTAQETIVEVANPSTASPASSKPSTKDVAQGPSRWPTYTAPPPPPVYDTKSEKPEFIHPVKFPANPKVDPMNMNPMAAVDLTPKQPLVLALECIIENRHEEALRHLQIYDPRTQEFFLRILPTLSLVSKKKELTATDVAALNDQVSSLKEFLRANSDLTISKLCFCESIKGYAIYKPLAEDHEFVAGQGDRPGELLQIYVEMKNFASVPSQGSFETRLSSRVEITDEKGQKKWSHRFRSDDLTLISRTRLGEYYHNYSFILPSSLTPGQYSLTVTMTDETTPDKPRTARATVPLRVAGTK